MTNWIPVTEGETPHLGWAKETQDYSFAAEDTLAPLVTEELTDALRDQLIAFAYDDQAQEYRLMALQSLQNGINVYVGPEGKWLGRHKPRIYANHPFALVALNAKQAHVYINQAAKEVHQPPQDEDSCLFDDQGQLTAEFQEKFNQLQAYHRQTQVTQAQVNLLAQYQLIQAWPLELNTGPDGTPEQVEGLYRIDQDALNKLDEAASADLVRSGALQIAYAQILSYSRLIDLSRLYAYQRQVREAEQMRQEAVKVMEQQEQELQSSEDDDLFKF